MAALREMLLNALVHRSYMGAPIQLRIYDYKLSIWNEGLLPNGLDLDSLKREHHSRPRNPKIADACFKAGYIDTWGRGTLKIYNACHEAGLPEPEIIEMDGGVQVTIFKDFKENRETDSNKLVDGLVESQQEIIKLMAYNPKISKREMAERIGISETAIDKNLSALKSKNIIKRIGGNRSGYWKILAKR